MKKIVLTNILAVLLTATLFSQIPQSIPYQAVIRNANNEIIRHQNVSIKVTLLQGNPISNTVYTETHLANSGNTGLVALAIGAGTVVSGSFETIDWKNGPYYIKTETDLSGGTNYTIIDTTEMLSVPYAFRAEVTDSVIYKRHYPGELYGGGVVAWVDKTGEHGIIISMIDLSTNATWSNISNLAVPNNGAKSEWNGEGNSSAIVAQTGHTSSAAKLCDEYTNADYGTGVYGDWYLPSRGEWNDMWKNFKAIQKALAEDGDANTKPMLLYYAFWTSTEYDDNNAFVFFLKFGYQGKQPKYFTDNVRAVRKF